MQHLKFSSPFILTIKIVIFITVALLVHSCKERIPCQKEPLVPRTPLNIAVIADTVIYDVIIKNPDPEDLWTEECLRNLYREGFIDIIFNAIYRQELIPYDYFSNQALSVKEIIELEKDPEFSRENIGRIQFSGAWYFDEENLRMEKRINSLSFGYEVFDLSGNLRGYKPAFMVKLN